MLCFFEGCVLVCVPGFSVLLRTHLTDGVRAVVQHSSTRSDVMGKMGSGNARLSKLLGLTIIRSTGTIWTQLGCGKAGKATRIGLYYDIVVSG
jgi:hypothetical protein